MKNEMKLILGSVLTGAVLMATTMESRAAEATVGADVVSAYVWRGITFNDSLVAQPSVDVAHPSGLNFNVWGNYDLQSGDTDGDGVDDVSSGDFQEIDLTVSYAVPVEAFDLSVGIIEYAFPGGGSSTTEAFADVGTTVAEFLDLGLGAYYDIDEVEDYYLSIGAGFSVPLTEDLGIDLAASIGYAGADMSAGDDEGFHDYNISASTAVPLSGGFKLGAFIAYTGSLDSDVLPDQEVDLYGGVSLYHSF